MEGVRIGNEAALWPPWNEAFDVIHRREATLPSAAPPLSFDQGREGGWLRSGFRDWKERGGVNALGRRKEGRRESWKKELSGIVDDREDEGGRSPPRRF